MNTCALAFDEGCGSFGHQSNALAFDKAVVPSGHQSNALASDEDVVPAGSNATRWRSKRLWFHRTAKQHRSMRRQLHTHIRNLPSQHRNTTLLVLAAVPNRIAHQSTSASASPKGPRAVTPWKGQPAYLQKQSKNVPRTWCSIAVLPQYSAVRQYYRI